jgi:hypothetical protein
MQIQILIRADQLLLFTFLLTFFGQNTPISHFLFLGLSKIVTLLFELHYEYRTLLLEGDSAPLKPPASKGVVFYMRGWARRGLKHCVVGARRPLPCIFRIYDPQIERDIVPDNKLDVVRVERSLQNRQRVLDWNPFCLTDFPRDSVDGDTFGR